MSRWPKRLLCPGVAAMTEPMDRFELLAIELGETWRSGCLIDQFTGRIDGLTLGFTNKEMARRGVVEAGELAQSARTPRERGVA